MKRAVGRGLERRENDEIAWIGMDEKSFRKGHNYISLINDLEEVRVLDVVEGREGSAADSLIEKALDEGQREMVCGVAIDMSAPFIKAIRRHLPHADIVHDKFHIAKHLYLLLRDFHDRDEVLAAKDAFQRKIQRAQDDDVLLDTDRIAHEKTFLKLFESKKLFGFFDRYFSEPALTYDHKWLRSIPPGGYTGLHFDNVYMGRGSGQVHTVWNPIGDIDVDLGTLVVNVGSHRERKKRLIESYGKIDVDRDNMDGWYSHDPREYTEKYGGQWQTTNVNAGDIIIITMFTMHCSARNLTCENRYSCDIRFQPASESTDERWYGKDRSGHTDYGSGKAMVEFKKKHRI